MTVRATVGIYAQTFWRKSRTAIGLRWSVIILLLPAAVCLAAGSALRLVVPMRMLCGWKGNSLGAVALVPLASEAQRRRAQAIKSAVRIVSQYTWYRSDCYPQALASMALARFMCIPYALHLGVASDRSSEATGGIRAHAWIVSGRVSMAGKNISFRDFVSISCWTNVEIVASANQA
tara:strand:- start:3551 stop:4081 length:531 start_codon:yes stop_codon:yes gene_type:complete